MELLEERIRRDGVVKSEGVLKVDSFLNHQLDIDLFDAMGEEFKRLFADAPITKILTIEASGIGIACVVARHFGVPVVFAKKAQSINLDGEMFTTRIESFTHGRVYDVIVSKKFLNADDMFARNWLFASFDDRAISSACSSIKLPFCSFVRSDSTSTYLSTPLMDSRYNVSWYQRRSPVRA